MSGVIPHKVAIVANTTWNIYNFRLNVIQKLLDEGHEVVVIAPVDEFITYKERFPQVTHVPIHHLDRDSVNPLHDIRLTMELSRLYRKIKPDFIIHYTVKPNIYGGFAARMLGIPSVAFVTGLGYAFIHNGMVKKMTKSLYKLSASAHRKFIFENEDDKALFEEQHLIGKNQGIAVKGCGVNTEFFKPASNHIRDGKKTIFTFIGRLLYDKGVREFIEAAHEVKSTNPETEFWMIGEIDRGNPSAIKEDDLVKWIRDANIKYFGSTHQVHDFIEKSDCIVLPSYREGMSRVIMEAMAMERPVITTDTAGCRETIDPGETGLLVPVRDTAALAEAIRQFLLLSKAERELMGQKGRKKAIREFDDKVIADQLYHILSDSFSA